MYGHRHGNARQRSIDISNTMLSASPLVDSTAAQPGSSLSSSFLLKYCRMCALEVKQGVYIFGEEGRRLQLPEKIRKTIAILVLEEDSLPKKICTSCCNSLEAYTQFKDSVNDAQDKLSSIAKSIEKTQEQNLMQLRRKQLQRSPKHPKPYRVALPHSSNHVLIPAPSLLCTDDDYGDPLMECDDPPSSVVSSEGEEPPKNVPVPECTVAEAQPRDEATEELAHMSQTQTMSTLTNNKFVTPNVLLPLDRNSSALISPPQTEATPTTTEQGRHISDDDVEQIESDAQLVCGLCVLKIKDKESLITHHIKHHDTKIQKEPMYGCSACSRISPNHEAIRQHIYRHRMAGAHKCADCDKSYSTKDQLDVHISSKHNPSGTKAFSCNVCGKQYGTNIALGAHLRKKHSPSAKYSSRDNLEERVSGIVTLATTIINSNSPEFPSSSNNSVLSVSVIENKEKDPVKPTVPHTTLAITSDSSSNSSNESFENDKEKDKHQTASEHKTKIENPVVAHKSIPITNGETDKNAQPGGDGYWKCDMCDKILHSKQGYDGHIKVHKGQRFTCEYCGVTYTQKGTLEHHIKVHHTNADKDFECPECDKSFKTIRQLGWHKKTHEKPLTDVKCPQCEKKFLNMISLKTHMKLHKGSKNYPCSECPKSFYTKLKLEEHLNSHSGLRPFGCPTESCGKVFSCFSNYAKHFKKHHYELLGPRGSMIPPPKMLESNNNNTISLKHKDPKIQRKENETQLVSQAPVSEKEVIHTKLTSQQHNKIQDHNQLSGSSSSNHESHSNSPTSVHFQNQNAAPPTSNVSSQAVLKTNVAYYSTSNSSLGGSLQVQPSLTLPSTTSHTSSTGGTSVISTMSASHHNNTITLHAVTNDSSSHLNVAHHHPANISASQVQHAHHHPSVHSSHAHSLSNHPQPLPQFQQSHSQSVWQPVILPGSKTYHHPNSTTLSTINGVEMMDCNGPIHPPHPPESVAHSQHGSLNSIHVPLIAAHHSTPSHPSHVNHGSISSVHPNVHNSHSLSHSIPVSHGISSHATPISHSSAHISTSSSSSSVTVPNYVPSQQNEPMELSYKLESNNFQEMPMELTKVFQRDPLELCVRQEFTQPLMDLSSRVVNVSVGNPSINGSSLSMTMNGGNSHQNYGSVSSSSGGGPISSAVLNVPYHKSVDMVERELSLNDFTGAFRQPIDLIARGDDQSHELCSEGSLVDLSLRSSFGQDHSASSFLRELIDLSARPDSFHGEINLTNKPHQPTAHSHSQLHQHSHSSAAHTIVKPSVSNSHHHHHNHHPHPHHHHHTSAANQHSASSVALQNVMYHDTMFSLQS